MTCLRARNIATNICRHVLDHVDLQFRFEGDVFENFKYSFRKIILILYKYMLRMSFSDMGFGLGKDLDYLSKLADLERVAVCRYNCAHSKKTGSYDSNGLQKNGRIR